MKTTHFRLENPEYSSTNENSFERTCVRFRVPTLPAYSFTNHAIDGINTNVDGMALPIESAVVDDIVIIYGVDSMTNIFRPSVPVLTVYHFGISDYSKLFPEIEDLSLRNRVGRFMEEADKTFEQEAWLSFVVMAGGVFEGVLSDLLNDHGSTFGALVNKVSKRSILEDYEISVLKDAVYYRNHVHAGRYKEDTADRKIAMDMRVQLDQYIKKNWRSVKESLAESNGGDINGQSGG